MRSSIHRPDGERAVCFCGAIARTALLRADNLDPDLLDERARVLLGYGHPGDLVVLRPGRAADD